MTIPAQGISLLSIGRGILGIMALLLIAYLLSTDRKNIPWRTVATGLALHSASSTSHSSRTVSNGQDERL